MTTREKREYQRLPKTWRTMERYHTAKTLAQWKALEEEFVRIRIEPDENWVDIKGDMFNPKYIDGVPGGLRTMKAQEKEFDRKIEQDGIWGIIGQYRLDPESDEWICGASCWGYLYTDTQDIACTSDIMAETLHEFKRELRSRQLLAL